MQGKPRKPPVDLSTKKGNPTSALQDAYSELMSIDDPALLAQRAIEIVKPLINRGVSERNYAKFARQLAGAQIKGIGEVQKFLTNYILAGSGLGVAENKIAAIGSLLTEDADVTRQFTREQHELKNLVESNTGFKVYLLSE